MLKQGKVSGLSPLGLGTSRIRSLGSALPRREAEQLIHAALEMGVRVIDTADAYGAGDAERCLGQALRGRRAQAFVVTKAGYPYLALPRVLSPLNQIGKKALQAAGAKKRFTATYLVRSLERSLRRLEVDYVDAFLLHEPEREQLPAESWEALRQIRQRGLARWVGVSTSDVDAVQMGLTAGELDLVETGVKLGDENAAELLHLCAQHRVPVIANAVLQPLGNSAVRRRVAQGLEAHGLEMSVAAYLVARAAAQQPVRTVLIGTHSVAHLRENIKAAMGHGTATGIESIADTAALPEL